MSNFFKSTMLKQVTVILFLLFAISTSYADDIIKDNKSANYWLFPDVSNNSGVWLLNIKTGSLSKCVFVSTNTTPECSPWANPPGANPEYRYDMKSKKMIPMNQAAINKEKERDPLGIR